MAFAIFLVDDSPVQAAARKAILTYAGNKVWVATSPRDALGQLSDSELAKQLSLVITDHFMPEMNGPQFVTLLRQQFPTLPILVLSGHPDAEIEYEGMNVLYRLKPLLPEELIRLTQSLCENALGRIA